MGLTLGLSLGNNQTTPPPSVPDTICGAIHSRHEISANRGTTALILAPHAVYWKIGQPDALWLDAVIVSENGTPPRKAKLDGFKLTDLADVTALEATFEPFAGFKPGSSKYAGKSRCTI